MAPYPYPSRPKKIGEAFGEKKNVPVKFSVKFASLFFTHKTDKKHRRKFHRNFHGHVQKFHRKFHGSFHGCHFAICFCVRSGILIMLSETIIFLVIVLFLDMQTVAPISPRKRLRKHTGRRAKGNRQHDREQADAHSAHR